MARAMSSVQNNLAFIKITQIYLLVRHIKVKYLKSACIHVRCYETVAIVLVTVHWLFSICLYFLSLVKKNKLYWQDTHPNKKGWLEYWHGSRQKLFTILPKITLFSSPSAIGWIYAGVDSVLFSSKKDPEYFSRQIDDDKEREEEEEGD